jgi:enoyl-CoA hydratase
VKQPVTLTVENGLATMRIEREHGNAINGALAEALIGACREAEADPAVQGVLLAARGRLFSPGLDLQELIELDRPGLERFLKHFSACLLMLYTFPKPLVAALHGHTLAGGCVLSLTADWRVLKRGALIGLNEVMVGVPLPYGVTNFLREAVPPHRVEEVALFGRNYSDDAALAVGLAHEIHDEDGFEEYCLERLRELTGKDPNAFAITKRYLRSAAVERVRAHDLSFTGDFLDTWFSEPTQKRIHAILDQLKNKD